MQQHLINSFERQGSKNVHLYKNDIENVLTIQFHNFVTKYFVWISVHEYLYMFQ